jgi:hypothetical protein
MPGQVGRVARVFSQGHSSVSLGPVLPRRAFEAQCFMVVVEWLARRVPRAGVRGY